MFDQVESFCRPASVPEALRLLQRGKGRARIVAGGTDLVLAGGEGVRILVDITGAGLNYIRPKSAATAIGAATTLAEIEESAALRQLGGGILARAAATCGSVNVRNVATIGGNLANASAAADMATPLLILEAGVVVADARGRHKLSLSAYLEGAPANRFSKSILVELLLPETPGGKRCGWSFQKLGRTAVDISLVNAAAGLELDSRHGVKWARIALGAVAATAIRMESAEKLLTGQVPDAALLAAAGAEISRRVRPISDVRAAADYRREMSAVIGVRALAECIRQAGGES